MCTSGDAPSLSPFRGMPPAKILRGCRFPKWLPKWLFDSKEGGIERERGRPDINFAHARGKLVGTESRRMKLEPDRDRRRRRRRRRPRNEMQIWRLLGRGGSGKRERGRERGKRSGGGRRDWTDASRSVAKSLCRSVGRPRRGNRITVFRPRPQTA